MLRRLGASIVLLALAAALVWLALFLRQQGLQDATSWMSIISGFLTFVAVVAPAARPLLDLGRHGGRKVARITVDEAAEALSKALATEWAREEQRRRINDPQPLPVRWKVTSSAEASMVGVDWTDVGATDRQVEPGMLAGEFDEIHDLFTHRLPSRRLVLLGEAGAGKSVLAMKLASDLLADRRLADPVPVLLPIATWNVKEDLYAWVTEQLLRDHPGLDAMVMPAIRRQPTSLAAALVSSKHLLLILDGLDELPEPSRKDALIRINGLGGDVPLVVTSRTSEYLQAVVALGRGLSRAAVIELVPIDAAAIKNYLAKATSAVPAGRWDAVFVDLDRPTAVPIVEALQTPLMVWLTRTVYEGPDTRPSELTEGIRFADRAAVEHHLLDELIPALYGHKQTSNNYSRRWNAIQARTWLGFLARWLQRRQSSQLAWWHLQTAVPRVFMKLVVGLAVGLVLLLVVGIVIGPLVGLAVGLMSGVALGAVNTAKVFSRFASRQSMRRWWPSSLMISIGRAAAFAVGLAVGLQRALSGGLALGVAEGTIAGLTTGLIVGFLIHEGRSSPSTVEFRIREHRARFVRRILVGLVLGIIFGLVMGLTTGVVIAPGIGVVLGALAIAVGLAFGLMDGLNIWIDAPADVTRSLSPMSVLRADRTSSLARGLIVGLTVTIGAGLATAPGFGLVNGLALGLAFGLAFALTDRLAGVTATAWGTFALARTWLAMTTRLPWRVMAFLEDAYHRGVLRQVGATYQFRHARLQDRLTAQSPAETPMGS